MWPVRGRVPWSGKEMMASKLILWQSREIWRMVRYFIRRESQCWCDWCEGLRWGRDPCSFLFATTWWKTAGCLWTGRGQGQWWYHSLSESYAVQRVRLKFAFPSPISKSFCCPVPSRLPGVYQLWGSPCSSLFSSICSLYPNLELRDWVLFIDLLIRKNEGMRPRTLKFSHK